MSKQSWKLKEDRVKSVYPDILNVNWSEVFSRDPDAFTKLLGEVIKSEGRGSKPGKRPQLARGDAEVKLAKIGAEDFSENEFHTAFKILVGDRSLMNIANKTGLNKSYVQRLLNQTTQPSLEAMETIATAFGRQPSYFLEYRVAHILAMMESFLMSSPETTAGWYLRFRGNDKLRLK
jgi:hypothetical protein